MRRVICHWTAGTHKASDLDRNHYHFIVEGDGKIVTGVHKPEDNLNVNDGDYAAHTRGANTGAIGVAMACMAGAVERPFSSGRWPMTKAQWDAMCGLVADLAKRYNIPVRPDTILSHAEVEATLKIDQAGKWDFSRLSWNPSIIGAKACGDLMRAHVTAAMVPKPVTPPPQPKPDERDLYPSPDPSAGRGEAIVKALFAVAAAVTALAAAVAAYFGLQPN